MKKIFALLLALIMVMGLATVASAATTYAPSEATSFNITKTYISDEEFVPGETLSFTVTADKENPDDPVIVVGTNNTFPVTGKTNTISVAVPSYDTVGTYKYTIKEVEGNTAGVTEYDTGVTIHVVVLVEYDNKNNKLVIGNDEKEGVTYFIAEDENGAKTENFENTFKTAGFTVAKNVTGNMANKTDKFTIDVTLTSAKPVLTTIKVGGNDVLASEWTATDAEKGPWTYSKELTLSHDDAPYAFAQIPYGVQVSVAEDTTAMNGYELVNYTVNGTEGSTASFTVNDETDDVVVVNNKKETTVETGIVMDSVPFIVMIAIAVIGLVAFTAKKRVQE